MVKEVYVVKMAKFRHDLHSQNNRLDYGKE